MENQSNNIEQNNDFEVRALDPICVNESALKHPWWYTFKYMAVGIIF